MNLIILILIVIMFSNVYSEEQHCFDYMLFDGSEKLVTFGMDTTDNWWAVTQPFTEGYRLIVNGYQTDVYKDIRQLTFSPNSERWACFLKDNTQWYLVSNDTIIEIRGSDVGSIEFSPNSKHLIYSYFESNDEILIYKERRLRVLNRKSKYYLSNNAERIAWVSEIAGGVVYYINGNESDVYDDVIPFGFWYNGDLLYTIQNGDYWEIYKGDEVISDTYSKIPEVIINLKGTVAAAIATEQSGKEVSILISDEYYEPLIGNRYDQAYNLILHPELPILAHNASQMQQEFVVMNTVEYYGGSESTGMPEFTHDGNDLYFLGCNLHCFVNVNGRKHPMNSEIIIDRSFAKKPDSPTIAYSTNTSMIVRNIETNYQYAGMMTDQIISPRFNWRESRYEALGSINNRLYLMTCNF